MATPKIIVEKPPIWGAAKGAPGFKSTDAWTAPQRAAGMRREIPLGAVGQLGTNRVAPPPPPPRQQLAQIMAPVLNGSNSGGTAVGSFPGSSAIPGGFSNANRAGFTTSGSNTFGNPSSGGNWGYTPSGVRSSWSNPNGSWGNALSGNLGGGGRGFDRGAFSDGRGGFGSAGPGLW
jgi:hypothetical protein